MDFKEIIIRHEEPAEIPTTAKIVSAAFGRENEVKLLEALRQTAEFNPKLSLVADDEQGNILGYALYFQVLINSPTGSRHAAGLYPIAVAPEFQRSGVGERLVRHGLQRCGAVGHELVFVHYLPQFFTRFGFRPARPLGLNTDLPVQDTDFLVIDMTGMHLGKLTGKVEYPKPFFGS